MSVLTDLCNRGVKDVFFVVCDGLKGRPEVVSNVWPHAIVQTCIIHLIRNTFRPTSRKYWDEIKRDIKPIYIADVHSRTSTLLRTGTKMNHDVTCSPSGVIAFRAQVDQWDQVYLAKLKD